MSQRNMHADNSHFDNAKKANTKIKKKLKLQYTE
jgi:hypothetical protein